MRFPTTALVAALVLTGSLAVAVPSAAAAVPSAPYTALTVAGTAVPGGPSQSAAGGASTAVGDQVVVEYKAADRILVSGHGDGGAYLAVFAPTGTVLTAGSSFPVQEQADATHGGVFVSSVAQQCRARVVGTVTVLDLTTDADGVPTSVGLDVSTTCDDGRQSTSLRWNSSSPWTGVSLQPGVTDDLVTLGQHVDTPVTLRASGTTGLPAVTGVTLAGDVEAFTLLSDGCTGITLAVGRSCTVLVRSYPRAAGDAAAVLTLAHAGPIPFEVQLQVGGRDTGLGTYYPQSPQRVLDTRTGTGVRKGAVPTGGTIHLDTDGFQGYYASAFVLNLTVDHPAGPGYLTAFPSGTKRPTTSSLNFPAGWQGANLVTVPVGAKEGIDIYNGGGRTSIIADVVGFYANTDLAPRGGGYHATAVERLLDTRTWGKGKLKPDYYATIPISYRNDGGHIAALSVTVTAVNPTRQGYLTTWDGSADSIPGTSTLNFGPNTGVISNAAVVPTTYCPDDVCHTYATIGVLNRSSAAVDVVVDVNGFFDDGRLPADVRYSPLTTPTRIVDTRSRLGTTTLGPDTTRLVTAPTSVAGYDTIALDANVTAVAPTRRTFVTVWPAFDDYPRPLASVLNPLQGQTIADHTIAALGYGNRFNLYNATGTTNLVVDVSGTFELFPPTPPEKRQQRAGSRAAGPSAVPVATRLPTGASPTAHRAVG